MVACSSMVRVRNKFAVIAFVALMILMFVVEIVMMMLKRSLRLNLIDKIKREENPPGSGSKTSKATS
jgi:hypothetical protein